MAFIPASYEYEKGAAYAEFATTAAVAITKGQLVAFGADDDTITGTLSDINLAIGVAMETIASGATGATRRTTVRLLGSGVIFMISNGTVTRGSKLIPIITSGQVTNSGAAPDARQVIGRAMLSDAVAADWVPVLIG